MSRTEGLSSILFGIIISVIMAGMISPALTRLLSLSLSDSILK